MSNSGRLLISRDQVLVAHAADMIARTGFSQDDFAQTLSVQLHCLVPEKAIAKDVPAFNLLAQGNDTVAFLKASGAWLRRVGRWLSGEVDLPTWIEESWVLSLDEDHQERCINELASRHGLTGARELNGDGNPVGVFGQLVTRLGATVQLGSEILADGQIDSADLEKLPEFVDRLRAVEARCSELRARAQNVIDDRPGVTVLHKVN
ncbi:hypothetical protein ALQ72_03594 [Pseudomonas syringae pv. maculicola]|uniref:Uncharacterized protein n=1 Tax=Pseudomonas syringae pv. maculicola TaxID=59511 RepID=A0A0N0FYL2_PSEYM|nr:hypothetical protein [Pseudomonas syringae group genomosp. 3]KPB91383.1 Uncharacterized protein AC503_0842 [Pseudomonas syringae pv. maculicola]MBM0209657.1 hypothetical protein [Pseudomonas syringae pv. maculicola]RMM81770.1 hypothetical protein ALQ72_03594 [Pseudomonas syringae pv. maculicola]RMV30044.1 hypothetical protein ALP13_03269 [Pseudomonas syringae pv. maculicola]